MVLMLSQGLLTTVLMSPETYSDAASGVNACPSSAQDFESVQHRGFACHRAPVTNQQHAALHDHHALRSGLLLHRHAADKCSDH